MHRLEHLAIAVLAAAAATLGAYIAMDVALGRYYRRLHIP